MFLGVPSVVRMTTNEEKIKLAGVMNITKHKHLISSGFFRVISLSLSGIFSGSEIWHGIFCRLIFVPGIFWGFVGSPRDFFGF